MVIFGLRHWRRAIRGGCMKLWHGMSVMVLALALAACGGKAWSGDPQLVHKLDIKMTEAQVRAVLGEPSDITSMEVSGLKQDVWIYNGSERVGVVFQNDKLVAATLAGRTVMEASVNEI